MTRQPARSATTTAMISGVRLRATIIALLVSATVTASGCDEQGRIEHDKGGVDIGVTDTGSGTIFSMLIDAEEMSTLTAAIGAADLVTYFEAKGPVTLLAPTNVAWSKLGSDRLERLMTTETKNLRQGILNHTIKGRIRISDMYDGQVLKSVGGPKLTVRVKGPNYYVGGARIIVPDQNGANGVIQIVDRVIR